MPVKTSHPLTLQDVRVKFDVLRECLEQWIEELQTDLETLEQPEVSLSDKNVIRFPGKRKS